MTDQQVRRLAILPVIRVWTDPDEEINNGMDRYQELAADILADCRSSKMPYQTGSDDSRTSSPLTCPSWT